MLQNPFRNSSIIGVNVYSHSGEFSPQFFDLTIPGRGLSFQFVRKYRSSNSAENNILGRGWDFNYGKWLESNDEDNNIIIYHDGFGRIHHFDKLTGTNIYRSPNGIYSTLSHEGEDDSSRMLLKERFGTLLLFEKPSKINHNVKNNNHDGFSSHTQGRLLSIKDRNGNTIEFKYTNNAICVIDSLGREITMTLDNKDRIIKLQDHANRIWYYNYNQDECLVEIVQPTTREFPEAPRIKYAYDTQNRLKSITDPNGQTFLENYYDEEGRVSKQNHGDEYFEFKYDKIGNTENDFPIYNTIVKLKNESNIILTHNEQGLLIERTSFISSTSLHPEDLTKISLYSDSITNNNKIKQKDTLIPLVTKSKFNKNNEVMERTFPAGNTTKRIYDENSNDPLSRANLLQIIRAPSKEGKINAHEELAVLYSYEPRHNFVESFTNSLGFQYLYKYDDRGNRVQNIFPKVTTINDVKKENNISSQTKSLIKTSTLVSNCTYNDAGQIISYIDINGSTTDYYYYPANDPCGIVDNNKMIQEGKGGYLAKIVRNPNVKKVSQLKDKPAKLVKLFGYDIYGNRIAINDDKSNPVQI
jgi:YD repeat-containing protein